MPTPPPSATPTLAADAPTAWRLYTEDPEVWGRNLGPIAVTVRRQPSETWMIQASHGEPPRGGYGTREAAQQGADRHMRAQLENTLSLLTAAEELPVTGAKPRPCGVVLLYATDTVAAKRRDVMRALLEVS